MFDSNNKSNINIDQTPLEGGASNIATHRLKKITPSRYEFKATFGAVLKILQFLFIIIIFFLIILYVLRNIFEVRSVSFNFIENPIMIIPIFIIFVFVIDIIKVFISILKPLVFDKTAGLFWKGFCQPNIVYTGDKKRNMVKIKEIQGLQILKKVVQGKMNTYVGYELNLVLNNSERINVIDHGNLRRVKEDAQKLGQFLNVPVLDGVAE